MTINLWEDNEGVISDSPRGKKMIKAWNREKYSNILNKRNSPRLDGRDVYMFLSWCLFKGVKVKELTNIEGSKVDTDYFTVKYGV